MEKKKVENGVCKHQKAIHCDAKNCVFHDGECYCTADRISVGPSNAKRSSETACATFEQKTF